MLRLASRIRVSAGPIMVWASWAQVRATERAIGVAPTVSFISAIAVGGCRFKRLTPAFTGRGNGNDSMMRIALPALRCNAWLGGLLRQILAQLL